jgi:mRNA interferase HigB
MVVISKTILARFAEHHADAVDPLNEWWVKTKASDWHSLQDIRKSFRSVDYVGNDRYIFNIKGNKYRLVAMIFLISAPFTSGLWAPMRNTIE